MCDKKENLNRAPSARQNTNIQNVIEAINNSSVSFSVWEKRDADGKASGMHDWTSMVGNEKKELSLAFPRSSHKFFTYSIVIQLFKYGR